MSPGTYLVELYGASGGFVENHVTLDRISQGVCTSLPQKSPIQTNVGCPNLGSVAGAGGYTSGIITLNTTTKAFLAIGGKGTYSYVKEEANIAECFELEKMIEGGYNGGGWASNFYYTSSSYGTGSGGGSTDLRFEEDDVFHRVIVAGAGGGTDDQIGGIDDGSGGSSGGLIAQGFWEQGTLNNKYVATQTSGFTFGSGESAQQLGSKNTENGVKGPDNFYSDRGGSGSGWFGGFASHHADSGAGGGSSFILTSDAEIPEGNITHHDTFYNVIDTQPYAFSDKQKYLFTNTQMYAGVWAGNGMAIITLLHDRKQKTCQHSNNFSFVTILTNIMISKVSY